MATIRDDFDGEPLARFPALYSPAGRVCRRLVLPRGNVGLHMMREVIALTTQH